VVEVLLLGGAVLRLRVEHRGLLVDVTEQRGALRRAAAAELEVELVRHGLAHGVGERGVADAPEQRLHLGGELGAPVLGAGLRDGAVRDGLVAVWDFAVLGGEDAGLEQVHEHAALLLGAVDDLVHLARAADVDDVGDPGAVGSRVLQVVQALELDLVVVVGRHRRVSSGFVGFRRVRRSGRSGWSVGSSGTRYHVGGQDVCCTHSRALF
jgi:hypothetical protein